MPAGFQSGRPLVGQTYALMASSNDSPTSATQDQQPPNAVMIWDARDGRMCQRIPATATIAAIGFSADGRWIGIADETGLVSIYGVETGEPLIRCHTNLAKIDQVKFTSDGSGVLLGNGRSLLHKLDLRLIQSEFDSMGIGPSKRPALSNIPRSRVPSPESRSRMPDVDHVNRSPWPP